MIEISIFMDTSINILTGKNNENIKKLLRNDFKGYTCIIIDI